MFISILDIMIKGYSDWFLLFREHFIDPTQTKLKHTSVIDGLFMGLTFILPVSNAHRDRERNCTKYLVNLSTRTCI